MRKRASRTAGREPRLYGRHEPRLPFRQLCPADPEGKRLLAHELTHVVQQRQAGGRETAAAVIRRAPGPPVAAPSAPEWLGPLRSSAAHLQGDIWEVPISSLGRSPVGPHDQMQSYLRVVNQSRAAGVEPMESAHIIGGEHIRDLGWEMPTKSTRHWRGQIPARQMDAGDLQSPVATGTDGGRTTPTAGRPLVGADDVKALHNEVYRGIPELQEMSQRIVNLEAKRVMAAKYGMPKPTLPMDAHEGGMPKSKAPMDAHEGGMPRPASPMDAHEGGMPKPQAPMDAHQGGMPKPQAPMEAHEGGMPKPTSPLEPPGGVPFPEPVPEPALGFRGRLSMAKGSFGAGIKAAFSAENIAAAMPQLVLEIADRIAARDAIRAIEVKFAKEGFARGVAAGVTAWSAAEVASSLR